MTVSAPRPQIYTSVAVQPTSRKLWRAVLAILLCQVLAIVLVEAFLWCAAMGEEEIFHFDREIGFVHMHDKRITWRTEGFAQSYLDSNGLREHNVTVAKPADTYRVALLGDSLVEGLQVTDEQTFGQIIARRLSPLSGKKVQVLNFATSGYSTVQEYLLLKRNVMQFQPDLVLDCYNNRDLFENWTAPDQVITNVRPIALHLPGGKLVIDNLPVRRWLRSPRGQFMLSTNWLRAHSRIMGLLAELDLDLSQHNRFYRAMVDAISHPKNAMADLQEAIASLSSSGPSFKINFFEDSAAKPAGANVSSQPAPAHVINSATGNDSFAKTPMLAATSAPKKANGGSDHGDLYTQLVSRTLASLFDEMHKTCAARNCDFAVVCVPARAQLCPLPGSDTAFNGINYDDELNIVHSICSTAGIPCCDVEAEAEKLPEDARPGLFYAAHLKPQGQQFIADVLQPFVRKLLCQRAERESHSGVATAR